MKHILSVIMLSWLTVTAWAQDCVIPLGIYVKGDKLPEASVEVLRNKLGQAITVNGVEGGRFSQFAVVAQVSEIQEEVIEGVRPQYLKVITLNLSVCNAETGDKFSSKSLRLKGAGTAADRAFNSAFAKLQDESAIASLLESAKSKIIAYYDSQINNILAQCKSYCVKQQYEEALCLLAAVPTCCQSYAKVQQELATTYQQYVDYDCAQKIQRARAIWAASQTREAALMAGAYLSAINPSSTCVEDAVVLMAQIQSRMGEGWELEKELVRGTVSLEAARIEAARAIGVAYGQNQKAQTYNDHWIVR